MSITQLFDGGLSYQRMKQSDTGNHATQCQYSEKNLLATS